MSLKRQYDFYSYDAFPDGSLKMSSVLKAMQQLAREDLDNMGITYPVMRQDNLVFVLIKLRVKFTKPISIYDKIFIHTIPVKIVGIYFIRDFFFYDENGNIIGEASSSWVLLNYATRRPLRPTALTYDIPHSDEITADCPLSRSISAGVSPAQTNVRCIRLSDMDENNHLNNAIIADFITDELENKIAVEGKNVRDIEIHFHKEARLSDALELSTYDVTGVPCDTVSDSENNGIYEVFASFKESGDLSFCGRVVLF